MKKSLSENNICALYIRISRDETEEHRKSIQTQKKILDQYCFENNLQIYDYYIDEGISGTTIERPNFIRMLEDIKYKRVDTVIVKDLSRLGRNHLAVGSLLEKEFVGKVRFISVSEHIDTAYGYDETIPLRNYVNEYYSKDLSKKVKSGLKNKASKTRISSIQGGFYGYKYKPGTHDLEVDENVRPIIELIYKMHLEGFKTGQIAKKITELHTPTPGYLRYLYYNDKSGYKEGRGTEYTWSSRVIRDILNKYEYTGNTIQYKTTIINKKRVDVPKELHIHLKNTHPAIITLKMFDDAQKLLKHTKINRRQPEFLNETFQGIVFNDDGHTMSYVSLRGKYEYRARVGNRYGIPADDLKEIVLEEFKSLISSLMTNEEFVYETLSKNKGISNNEIKINELQKKYNELNKEGSSLFTLKLTKQISAQEYRERMTSITKELEEVEKELHALEEKQINFKNLKVSFNHFKELVMKSVSDNIIAFAKEVIEKIVVFKTAAKEYKIQIYYKYIG